VRRLWAIPALALWVVAVLWRLGTFLDPEPRKSDSAASWGFLCVLVGIVVAYALWRTWVAVDGSEWLYGWRD